MAGADEFDLIKTYFAPLAKGFSGSLGLTDDAAVLGGGAGRVVSTDGFAEGVHFRDRDSAYAIGEKILRASLSDLAAMGAQPECWFLTAAFGTRLRKEIKSFAKGCSVAQDRFGLALAGGDMVRLAGDGSFFSVVVVGQTKSPVRRSGGKVGDRLYVTGTLGDSALGLKNPRNEFLNLRYLYPEPRLALGMRLSGIAGAAIDLSDGLVADLGHLCAASKCGAIVYQDILPISNAGWSAQANGEVQSVQRLALNAGDDYELLIAVSKAKERQLLSVAQKTRTPLTLVGELTQGKAVVVKDSKGTTLLAPDTGYKHFT